MAALQSSAPSRAAQTTATAQAQATTTAQATEAISVKNAERVAQLRTLTGHEVLVISGAFSPDGRLPASGS